MRNFIFYFLLIFLISCVNKKKHEKYHTFSNSTWNTDSVIKFNFPIYDTINSYNFILKIRHSVDYEFQNLFIFLEGSKNDTIELILADKIGKWIGSGISDVREIEYIFETKRKFVKKEDYELRITQAMRYGSEEKIVELNNILDVGIIVLKLDD